MSDVTPTKFVKALNYIQSETKPRIEATHLAFLMACRKAGDTGLPMNEVAKIVGVTPSAAGRSAEAFTKEGRTEAKQQAGYDLLTIRFGSGDDYRNKYAVLNDRGVKVVDDFLAMLTK